MADELELRLTERYYKRTGPGVYNKRLILFICPVGYNEYSNNSTFRHKPLTHKIKGIEIVKEWIVPAFGKTKRSIRGRALKEAHYLLRGGLFLVRLLQANGELKYEREGENNERIIEDQNKTGATQSSDVGVGDRERNESAR